MPWLRHILRTCSLLINSLTLPEPLCFRILMSPIPLSFHSPSTYLTRIYHYQSEIELVQSYEIVLVDQVLVLFVRYVPEQLGSVTVQRNLLLLSCLHLNLVNQSEISKVCINQSEISKVCFNQSEISKVCFNQSEVSIMLQ